MTLTPAVPSHAWDVAAAAQHLPAQVARELPTGAALVPTDELHRLVFYARSAVEKNHMVLISGPAGSGKSTLVGALEGIAGVTVANVLIPHGSRSKDVWQEIARGVTGAPQPGTQSELQDTVRTALSQTPTLLIVDEAQNVGLNALLALRWLNNRLPTNVGMILAGVNLQDRFEREPQLSTRVKRRILLEPLPWPQMLPLLQQFHPVLAATDPELLERVDVVHARGLWRHWQGFLDAVDDFGITGALTEEHASAAVEMVTGRRPNLRGSRRAA
jgi:ABC-type polar amino acid transport system ATPase subunit